MNAMANGWVVGDAVIDGPRKLVEKTAKICDQAPIAPELASLTRLGTVASTPPEIGDPVIDQLDTGIGQRQQMPTEKAGDLQR